MATSADVTTPKPEAAARTSIEVINVSTLIQDDALAFKVDPVKFADTVQCESQGNLESIGDHGLAYGPLQFHKATFNWMKGAAIKEGEPFQNLSYTNPQDQITLGAWAFAHGEAKQWSCYSELSSRGWSWPARGVQ